MRNTADLSFPRSPERFLAAAGGCVLLAGLAVVAYFDPSTETFFPVCPLYRLTGFACPGCGLTRGMHALMHGDIVGALDLNALTPIFAVVWAFAIVSLFLYSLRGRGLRLKVLGQPWLLWGLLVLMGVFGIVRNLPVYPFSILFP